MMLEHELLYAILDSLKRIERYLYDEAVDRYAPHREIPREIAELDGERRWGVENH